MTAPAPRNVSLVVCVKNTGAEVSLELRKIYAVISDVGAKKHKLVRIIDESGEDYLYPEAFFVPVSLPPATRQAVLSAA